MPSLGIACVEGSSSSGQWGSSPTVRNELCNTRKGATELIHIGQTVIGFEGSIDSLVNTVFNYPTLAECYKVAALNGLNRINYSGEPHSVTG